MERQGVRRKPPFAIRTVAEGANLRPRHNIGVVPWVLNVFIVREYVYLWELAAQLLFVKFI